MTDPEFREWFRYHTSCFTGLGGWLDKITAGRDAPKRGEVLAIWFRVLHDVDLGAAKKATLAMHAGDIEEPKGYDRHPSAIRKAAGKAFRQHVDPSTVERYDVDGHRTYACLTCFDDGLVYCWSPVSVLAAREGRLGSGRTLYEMAVRCGCAAGERWRWVPVVFDPKKHLALRRSENGREVPGCMGSEVEQERLRQWATKLVPAATVPVTGGEYSEFDSFA